MSGWRVRHEGSPQAAAAAGSGDVLDGLRDGIWLPTDEVRGPADADWQPIESHPAFADAAADLAAPPEKPDDTNLDMNPLIDVCLVLLIFFILTITYETLRREIEVPAEQTEEKGTAVPKVNFVDIKDRIFRVTARMDGDAAVVAIEDKPVAVADLEKEMRAVIERTGRRELYLDADGTVPWGVLTAILDAAKGNGVHNILQKARPRK